MYLRYIYKLHDLHRAAENYTEAGFTMKLYADQLSWADKTLVSDPLYPGLSELERKEQLYQQIIHYFDRGKVCEKIQMLHIKHVRYFDCVFQCFNFIYNVKFLYIFTVLGKRNTTLQRTC